MARRVFFAFHYDRDIWRANVVRKSWVTQDREAAGFWDASLWEEAKKKGDAAIKKMIDEGLQYTSVTAVLIGAETSQRTWVQYEIQKSHERGNGLLGVYIHEIKDTNGNTDTKGNNPFDNIYIEENGRKKFFSQIYPTYYWVTHNGYVNFGEWVEKAAKAAGK
jgi:hypothetical protein